MDNIRGVGTGEKIGNKREGKVAIAKFTHAEAMAMDTAGQMSAAGVGIQSMKEGKVGKGGGKHDLCSDTAVPSTPKSFPRK